MKGKKHEFEAKIQEGRGGGAWVAIPFDVAEVFGTRGRVLVKATFEDVSYRGSIAPMGGKHILGVSKEIRQSLGKDIGDRIRVIIEKDTEERTVEVPPDLQAALKRDAAARAAFERMSYTHRKEYVQEIEGAKKPETRQRRIEKTLEMLRAKAG